MRDAPHFSLRYFAGPDIETSVYLTRVGRYHLAPEFPRKLYRQGAFARRGRPDDYQYLLLLHPSTLLQNDLMLKYDERDAGMAELVDAIDSKSIVRKDVWVRVPLPALVI